MPFTVGMIDTIDRMNMNRMNNVSITVLDTHGKEETQSDLLDYITDT